MAAPAQLYALSMDNPVSSPPTQMVSNKKTKRELATVLVGMAHQDVSLASNAGMEDIPVLSVVVTTVHNPAPLSDFFPVITPLIAEAWRRELKTCNILKKFIDIPISIQQGFNVGVHSNISHTYTPTNHISALNNPDTIDTHISKEQAAGCYSGPFS